MALRFIRVSVGGSGEIEDGAEFGKGCRMKMNLRDRGYDFMAFVEERIYASGVSFF